MSRVTKRSAPNTVNHSTMGPPIKNSRPKLRKSIPNPYNAIGLKKSGCQRSERLMSINTIKLRRKKVEDAVK